MTNGGRVHLLRCVDKVVAKPAIQDRAALTASHVDGAEPARRHKAAYVAKAWREGCLGPEVFLSLSVAEGRVAVEADREALECGHRAYERERLTHLVGPRVGRRQEPHTGEGALREYATEVECAQAR